MRNKIFTAIDTEFDIRESTNGWYRFTNPFDFDSQQKKDDTMAFNPTLSWVKCFRTGYYKSAVNFLMDHWELSYKETLSAISEYDEGHFIKIKSRIFRDHKSIEIPNHFVRLSFGDGLLAERARSYMKDRGFNIDVLDSMGFGFFDDGDYMGYILIPYISHGDIVYWTARDYINNFLKYKNPPVESVGVGKADLFFNEDALQIFDKVCCLEGALDAVSIGRTAIASSGWSLSKMQIDKIIKSPAKHIVFIPDAGFYNETKKQAAKIIFHKKVSILDTRIIDGWSDVNDYMIKRGIKPLMKLVNDLPVLTIVDLL